MTGSAKEVVRIGCAAAFWGDTKLAARQLMQVGNLDYLVFDYLAEITMSLLARARSKNPDMGYAPDFVADVIKPLAGDIARQKVKVIANAGGVNPLACKAALEAVLREQGVDLTVAAVIGDDVSDCVGVFQSERALEMFTHEPMPQSFASANCYLGAPAIAQALARGADIVVTGRVVDSATTLGALMYEFPDLAGDHDFLSAASLAGHVLECGTQATGGVVTDWEEQVEGWDDMGFPIVEFSADGSFVVTKPEGTGGRVTPSTVAEQVVYEVGDPAAYLLPDVTCDFSDVRLEAIGQDRVRVSNAQGRAPTKTYKTSGTWHDGYRVTGTLMIGGQDAARKAQAVGEALLKRTRRLFAEQDLGDYTETSIELLGTEANYGPHARGMDSREVILKIAAKHNRKAALEILARELVPAGTSMAAGITGFAAGRPRVQPCIRLFSFLVDKGRVPVSIAIGSGQFPVSIPEGVAEAPPPAPRAERDAFECTTGPQVQLMALARARSGDKGNKANIGLLARSPKFVPLLRSAVTADAVREYMSHLVAGDVERFEWPGLDGFNFLLHDALGGGGIASLRYDPQGKIFGQILLSMPVFIPEPWLNAYPDLKKWIVTND